jgi:glycogen debranching enzyme
MEKVTRTALGSAKAAQTDTAAQREMIRRAYAIAVRDLRACYNPDGIVAGRLHFNAYWGRDGFWALFGALALGDFAQALAQLTTFMRFQAAAGYLPVRVEFVGHAFGSYHTLRSRPKAVGRAGGLFIDPIDSTALFLIAAHEYLDRTHDTAFCERFNPVMDRAIGWLARHDRDGDGILESYFLADWMDSILKRNKVFNINVLYYMGLRRSELLKRAIGLREDAERLRRAADRVYDKLQEVFWAGEYFVDWIGRRRRGGFSADGNVLAVFFGVATEAQARQILTFIRERGLDTATPLRTCDPVYPWWAVFPLYYLAGIPDYHRTLIWPWLGTLNAVAKGRLGDRTGAVADLARIGEWYVRGNAVNEVYDAGGRPLSRLFYHAEVPFAWNAGLYTYAVHTLGLDPGDRTNAGGIGA